MEGRPDTLIINVNYDIAIKYGMMPDVIRKEMEDDKERRPALYKHKWLGEPNSLERKIYKDWNFIDEIPPEAKLERRGLDYGYTNDPSALVSIYKWNGAFVIDENMYQKGLSNRQIADIILNQDDPQCIVVPDSAEPKSNDELMAYGISVLPANKGRGSVSHGIQVVQSQRVFVTKRSINIIREYRNYLWEQDKNGKILNEPEHQFSHSMDAIRYAMETLNIDTGMSEIEKYMLNQTRMHKGINFSR
jgi:phage terminase large subunit